MSGSGRSVQQKRRRRLHGAALVLSTLLATVPLAGPASARRSPDPAPGGAAAPAQTTTRLGVSYGNTLSRMSQQQLAATLDDAVELNVRWIRADLSWADVQPTGPASFWWDGFDRVVRAARTRGLNVLPILTYTPPWARDPGCVRFSCPPRSDKEFAAFARAAVKRYASSGVTAWEIWNEPNFTTFWPSPDADRYAGLLNETIRTVRREDKSARLLLGGLAAVDPSWASASVEPVEFLERVCDHDVCSRLDGVSYHPYTYPYPASYAAPWFDTAWEKISSTAWSLRSVLDAHGSPTVKIWATEYGAPTGGPGTAADGTWETVTPTTDHVTEDWQATLAVDAVDTAVGSPNIDALFWYTNQDNPKAAGKEAYFGLRRSDGTQKPSWFAFRAAVARASTPPRPAVAGP
jgi:polysaccharide biosynthesis protein PslG